MGPLQESLSRGVNEAAAKDTDEPLDKVGELPWDRPVKRIVRNQNTGTGLTLENDDLPLEASAVSDQNQLAAMHLSK